jgi:hypothetical protein
MPLKLNVGLSRKIGEANYGSRGASVNVEMELDPGLVAEPVRLHERIRQLFGLARTSIAEELNGRNGTQPTSGNGHVANDQHSGNCHANGNGVSPTTTGPRPATQSQVKAIFAICKNRRFDVGQLLHDRFRIGRPDDLSIKQASQLIDQLKKSADQNGG